MSVPGSKVSVNVPDPSSDEASMYSRCSMPFICCSMSLITVSSTTCAEAPG